MDQKNKKLFPQRLWDLIHDNRCNHFLRWSEDGQRVYLSRNDFEEQYLRTPNNQFHTQKAISFVRQMNMYGFKKVDDCHYESEFFRRDCHHLIRNMVRRSSNKPHQMLETSPPVNMQQLISSSSSGPNPNQYQNAGPPFGLGRMDMSQVPNSLPSNVNSFAESLGDERLISRLNDRINQRDSFGTNIGDQDNLRVLYQHLASLNKNLVPPPPPPPRQQVSISNQALLLHLPGTKSNSITQGLMANLGGDISSIAQSSLASNLYQQLAVATSGAPSADNSRNTDVHHQQLQPKYHLSSCNHLTVPGVPAQVSASVDASMSPYQQQQQQQQHDIQHNQQHHIQQQQQKQKQEKDLTVAGGSQQFLLQQSMALEQSRVAQQMLQQSLIRSLTHLKLAKLPENFEANLALRGPCGGNVQQMRASSSAHTMELDPMIPLGFVTSSSSSSTSPVRFTEHTSARRSSETCHRSVHGTLESSIARLALTSSSAISRSEQVLMMTDDGEDSVDNENELLTRFGLNQGRAAMSGGASGSGYSTSVGSNLDQQSSASPSAAHSCHHQQQHHHNPHSHHHRHSDKNVSGQLDGINTAMNLVRKDPQSL